MLKCLIWGNGRIFHQYINTIKYYENLGEIGIVGISSNMVIFDNILDISVIIQRELLH